MVVSWGGELWDSPVFGAAWSVSDGEYTYNSATGDYSELKLTGLSSSKAYAVAFTASVSSNQISVRQTTTIFGPVFATGSHAVIVMGGDNVLFTRAQAGLAGNFSISNISVRELKGNHATQATAGNRPKLSQYNGHPSASFNGTTNSLRLATNPIGSNLSQPYTIIAGIVPTSLGWRAIYSDGARMLSLNPSGGIYMAHDSSSTTSANNVIAVGEAAVVELVYSGGIAYIYKNGVLIRQEARAAPLGAPGIANIGRTASPGTYFFNGQITGCAVFDRVLTDSERTTIGKAFAKELGVTYLG